ncbi:MAG: hypothetical protein V2I43_19080 [Parvularcula sp.]|nr:hypothetical protein [Parvularcula sp.]
MIQHEEWSFFGEAKKKMRPSAHLEAPAFVAGPDYVAALREVFEQWRLVTQKSLSAYADEARAPTGTTAPSTISNLPAEADRRDYSFE